MKLITSIIKLFKLGAVVIENIVDRVIEATQNVANTDKISDGKIFVSAIEEVVRISAGETGPNTI